MNKTKQSAATLVTIPQQPGRQPVNIHKKRWKYKLANIHKHVCDVIRKYNGTVFTRSAEQCLT